MKSIVAIAALTGGVLSQLDQISKPFRLFIKSDNATLDGQSLGACHQGAAIEGFCPDGTTRANESASYDTFYQQTQADPTISGVDGDPYGPLFWNLTVNGGQIVPSAMRIDPDLISNIVNPILSPGNNSYTPVSFTSEGCLYLARYQDDTVSPPTQLETPQKVQNWYICLTRWSYLYYTLSWKIGTEDKPQNPSCQKVDVVREFI